MEVREHGPARRLDRCRGRSSPVAIARPARDTHQARCRDPSCSRARRSRDRWCCRRSLRSSISAYSFACWRPSDGSRYSALGLDHGQWPIAQVRQEVVDPLATSSPDGSAGDDDPPGREADLLTNLLVCPPGAVQRWENISATGVGLGRHRTRRYRPMALVRDSRAFYGRWGVARGVLYSDPLASRLLPARSRNVPLQLARGRGSPPLRFASTRDPLPRPTHHRCLWRGQMQSGERERAGSSSRIDGRDHELRDGSL